MIKFIQENENRWMMWNKQTGDIADIHKITEHGMLSSKTARYRVDYNGKTVDTMIPMVTAKAIARKLVK